MSPVVDFLAYSWRVFSNSGDVAGVIAKVVGVVLLVAPESPKFEESRAVGVILLVLGWHIAGYKEFSKVKPQKEIEGDLHVDLTGRGADFGASSWGEMPIPPLYFDFEMTIRNSGSESVMLEGIELVIAQWDTAPLFSEKARVKVLRAGRQSEPKFEIRPGGWTDTIRVQLEVGSTYQNGEDLARRLRDFKTFSLEWELRYRSLNGTSKSRSFTVEGDFARFRRAARHHWTRLKQEKFLEIAGEE